MNKIEALQKTIYNLENDVYVYNFLDSDSCNCGILAKTILGGKKASEAGYFEITPKPDDGYIFSKRTHCLSTGIRLPEVFQALKDPGFTHEEMVDLEKLSNELILKRLRLTPYVLFGMKFHPGILGYTNKKNLIAYLKEWVKMLKEDAAANPPEQKPEPVKEKVRVNYVAVPETILENAETILN